MTDHATDHSIIGWDDRYQPVPVNRVYTAMDDEELARVFAENASPIDWCRLECECGHLFFGWNSAICAGLAAGHIKEMASRSDLMALLGELA